MTEITVVAAVLERNQRILLGLRPAHKRHGGLWEFPGGKVDPFETPGDALARELKEELGVHASEVGPRLASFRDPDSIFRIDFYLVDCEGQPEPLEHVAIDWVTLEEAELLPLAPSDRQMIHWLRGNRG
jgi:mutator protein MutT